MRDWTFDLRRGPSLARRRLLGGALAALGAELMACSRAEPSPHSEQQGQLPSTGGELIVAFDGAGVFTIGLDPHNSGYAPHNRVMRSIYDSLTRPLPDQSVGPWLAESWEISPERTSITFTLRAGVEFHDGTPFDAAALKANFDRLNDPANALTSRPSLGPYVSSEVLGSHRLRVNLSEPFTPFLRNLSMTKLGIVSPTAFAKYGKTFSLNPVGTGPFRFLRLVQGRAVHLEKNPRYDWAPAAAAHAGPAYLDQLTFLNVPEESTRVAVLTSGQAHAADLIPPQNLASLRANPSFELLEQELLETNYSLALNVSRPPWDDEELRLAVRLSLDIDSIVRSIYLGAFPRAWSSLCTSMFGSAERELEGSWKPDLPRARQIFERKGWTLGADGIRERAGAKLVIRFVESQGNREKRLDVIQLVKNQLKATGVRLYVDSQPPGITSAALAANEFDLYGGASFHGDPDILRQAYTPGVRPPTSGNKVVDAEIISWLAAAAREPDGPQRRAYYHQVQRKIIDKTYAIPIYVLLYNLAVSRRVQGIRMDAHGFPEFHDARLDSRAT